MNLTKNIKGDLMGGFTAGIVALPLALAFGIQAFSGVSDPSATSMGALAGLFGAMMLGFFASLFGGTHSQISGPTGPMTVVTASLITAAWTTSQNMGTVLVAMSMAGLFCGLFQILFGVIKIGKYVRYIPYPVLSGFMSGIGVIIILQQIYPLLGLSTSGSMIQILAGIPAAIPGTNLIALILGIATILIIVLLPKICPKVTNIIPATLIALIVVTVISLFMGDGLPIIGEIPSAIPTPVFVHNMVHDVDWLAAVQAAIVPGLTLAGLGSIDTLLTSVVADNITKTHHNPNKELMGQGIGNAIAGLFCGIAGAGATMRTVVNVKSGGRTQLSGMVHALFLLAVLLGLGSIVKFVPLSVLAGILITVGWGIIDFKGFKDLLRIPRADAFVLIVVFLMTVFVDLLTAVGIGMVIACVLFMKRAGDLCEGSYATGEIDKNVPWADEGGMPEELRHATYVQRLNGPVFFGSITRFQEVMHDVPTDVKVAIIRMKLVSFMDQSGAYAMETAIKDLQDQGVMVLMTIIQPQPMYMLKTLNIIPGLVPEDHTFKTFEECTDYLREHQAEILSK
ncbi:MAG: SulP family inorganic anion transporter [Bacteroidales bacterium]|nr:SulP family inorganic anion transporter [Bacteroidales bacterium]